MKLKNQVLGHLGSDVSAPTYDRSNLKHGIVHIGVGGFHRAHEAVYTHQLLQAGAGNDWSICGVGLRDADKAMQQVLSDQDHLYTLIELGADGNNSVNVIGSITDFLFAPDDSEAVIEKLASPEVKIVSMTITEGGYNVDDTTGRFNENHPDIQHDLNNPWQPITVFGYLGEALDRRRVRGLPPFTVMSCDNLPENGRVARSALLAFARLKNAILADWIDANVSFPGSMVDRITPGTHSKHRQWLQDTHGLEDGWPVICEPFSQWVLEDDFCNGRPEWEKVGVQFTGNVAPFERMKIRLLNASHSAMAYLGDLAGYRYTHEVMADERFAQFLSDFMDDDVTPILGEITGIDVPAYKQTLLERFSNPQMGDELSRLCMDGSSKIPKFLVPTIQTLINEARPLSRVALIIASWALYLRSNSGQSNAETINDPQAARLSSAVRDRSNLSPAFLGMADIFGTTIAGSHDFEEAFEAALDRLETNGVFTALKSLQEQ